MLLLGVATARAEDRAWSEARKLLPAPMKGWTATPVEIESHPVLDATQTIVATRTYTTGSDKITITIDTFNPVMTAFIDGAYRKLGADDPVARAGMRKYDLGQFRGIAAGPEENPSRISVIIDGNFVLTIERARGNFDLMQYLYEIRYTRMKAFAQALAGAGLQASL